MRAALLMLTTVAALLPAMAGAAELRPFGRGSWQEIVTAHAGRPTVIAFWSLGCPPCIAEMPLWRDVAENHPEVTVVLVATDPIEEADRLSRVLARYGVAGLETWAFADDFVERLRFEVDPAWRGELPRTHLLAPGQPPQVVTGLLEKPALVRWLGAHGGG